MSRAVVAVSMRLAPTREYYEERDAISHDWIRLLSALDLVPVLISNSFPDPVSVISGTGADRLLLTNGDSLGPLAGETGGPAPNARDVTEFALLDYAVEHGMPVLGVCRGLQVINAYFGGTVTRNLSEVTGEQHVAQSHDITLNSRESHRVNSFHDEGVLTGQLGDDLRIKARSEGGVVEALEHTSLQIQAVQWHPERDGAPETLVKKLFEWWLQA